MNKNINGYPDVNNNGNGNGSVTLYHIYERLGKVVQQLESEIAMQQRIIDKQLREIEALKSEMGKKDDATVKAEKQLQESIQNVEGNRQLINKLLSDIAHYQNDIDWYKRTYENRSFWGVVKDKLSKRS
jgi:DNA repair exonuclease SbcCD ATPase subunit